MIALLVKDQFAHQAGGQPTEDDIARYYAEHASSYRQGDRVEASAIIVSTPARAALVSAAVGALAPDDSLGFERLVAEYSEDPGSKAKRGSLGTLERTSLVVPPAVVGAAFALTEAKPLSSQIVAMGRIYFLRLVSRKDGSIRPLSEVHEEIARRLASQMRAREMDAWTANVRSRHAVTLNDAQMEKLIGP
jgi:parvulin-like peptidyl-prolyl isomerase